MSKNIIITVSGGVVQDISNTPPGVTVEVRDWDTFEQEIPTQEELDDGRVYIDPESGDFAGLAFFKGEEL